MALTDAQEVCRLSRILTESLLRLTSHFCTVFPCSLDSRLGAAVYSSRTKTSSTTGFTGSVIQKQYLQTVFFPWYAA